MKWKNPKHRDGDAQWASSVQFPCPRDQLLSFAWVLWKTSVLENLTLAREIFSIGISLLLTTPGTTRYIAIPSCSSILCKVGIIFRAAPWHVLSWQQASQDVRTLLQVNCYIPCESNIVSHEQWSLIIILLVASWLVLILVLHVFGGNQSASVKCFSKSYHSMQRQHLRALCTASPVWPQSHGLSWVPGILKKSEFLISWRLYELHGILWLTVSLSYSLSLKTK